MLTSALSLFYPSLSDINTFPSFSLSHKDPHKLLTLEEKIFENGDRLFRLLGFETSHLMCKIYRVQNIQGGGAVGKARDFRIQFHERIVNYKFSSKDCKYSKFG